MWWDPKNNRKHPKYGFIIALTASTDEGKAIWIDYPDGRSIRWEVFNGLSNLPAKA